MGPWLTKLLEIASPPIGAQCEGLPSNLLKLAGTRGYELLEMLHVRNGFYAFESALHVFHSGPSAGEIGFEEWNSDCLWRGEYAEMANGFLFFAQDVFGFQFCIRNDAVHLFNAETGSSEQLADSLEGWAQQILADYNRLTGYSLAHEWQRLNGQIPCGKRLQTYPPFVLGGELKVENLRAIDGVEMMSFRAHILNQTKDLPDGTKVRLRVIKR